MKKITCQFTGSSSDLYLDHRFGDLKKIVDRKSAILITDENIFRLHTAKFKGWNTIVLKAGEEYKVQSTVDAVIGQLIEMEADRTTSLVGVGGGVITDLTGYIASVYMRGLSFGFVPTTVLGLVDASIGGKNGIDVGVYKNLVGSVRQPAFILHDLSLLSTLPTGEWVNGFAEIIKHSCIKDPGLFRELEIGSLESYRKNGTKLGALIRRNVLLKIKLVQRDEFEKNERRVLNFGHTLGHALENQYELTHGQAIAIGMTFAVQVSEQLLGFKETARVIRLLDQYGLPTFAAFDKQKVFAILKMDKKRERRTINYILLNKTGHAVIKPISLVSLEKIMQKL